MASRALAQTPPASPLSKKNVAITASLTGAAVFGIAASIIPKRQETLRNVAIGGSVLSLVVTSLFFAFGEK